LYFVFGSLAGTALGLVALLLSGRIGSRPAPAHTHILR
jgi:hypothetical protein